MDRRWSYEPAVAARWLTVVESLGYPLSEVETTIRDEAVASLSAEGGEVANVIDLRTTTGDEPDDASDDDVSDEDEQADDLA